MRVTRVRRNAAAVPPNDGGSPDGIRPTQAKLFLSVVFGETIAKSDRAIDSSPHSVYRFRTLSIFCQVASHVQFPYSPSDDIFHHFISTPLDTLLAEHLSFNPEDKVLSLFRYCVAEVPAYRRFLEARGVNPAEITSFTAFRELPLLGKADYMQAYPLPERCLSCSLRGSDRVAVSSGSTRASRLSGLALSRMSWMWRCVSNGE